MIELSGGRRQAIYLEKDCVYRPWNSWSDSVHLLLNYLQAQGFTQSPRFLGQSEQGQEILSFIDGDVYNYPLQGPIASETALVSAAKLLKQFHQHSASFLKTIDYKSLPWMLESNEPIELVCHGDFSPYNVALRGELVVGVFDFDTAHPGSGLWDVAYAVYCWAPLKTGTVASIGTGLNRWPQQLRRARIFCDNYGLNAKQRRRLPSLMAKRLQALVNFMLKQASAGESCFIENVEHGHHLGYLADIDYINAHADELIDGLLN
ncbi:phosphotransferase [Alginatibacterium sediminis]|uniref:Phosphotransferase n=1 Tax=Alginatibacterium sediminis TaxID=2164068 RepID=A0A420EDF5_9ALTE|nr:phosphotransferase [Alginatibacterium sediminis]RKF18769.1 phosphotransferase [Alginatibacterium sediminis]